MDKRLFLVVHWRMFLKIMPKKFVHNMYLSIYQCRDSFIQGMYRKPQLHIPGELKFAIVSEVI